MRKQNILSIMVLALVICLLPIQVFAQNIGTVEPPLSNINVGSSIPGQWQDKIWVGMKTDKLVENMRNAGVIKPDAYNHAYLTVQPINMPLEKEAPMVIDPPPVIDPLAGPAEPPKLYGATGIILLVTDDGQFELETMMNGGPAGLSPSATTFQFWAYLTYTPELTMGQEMWFYQINSTYFIAVLVDKNDGKGNILYNAGGTVTDIVACSLEPLKRRLQPDRQTYARIPGLKPILTQMDTNVEVKTASQANGIGLGSTTEEIIRTLGLPTTFVPFKASPEVGSYNPRQDAYRDPYSVLTAQVPFSTSVPGGGQVFPLGQTYAGLDPVLLTNGGITKTIPQNDNNIPGNLPIVIKAGFSKNFFMVYAPKEESDYFVEYLVMDNTVIRVHYGKNVIAVPQPSDPIKTIRDYNVAARKVQAIQAEADAAAAAAAAAAAVAADAAATAAAAGAGTGADGGMPAVPGGAVPPPPEL